VVTGIEPTTSGLLAQRRSRSDNHAPLLYGSVLSLVTYLHSELLKLLSSDKPSNASSDHDYLPELFLWQRLETFEHSKVNKTMTLQK